MNPVFIGRNGTATTLGRPAANLYFSEGILSSGHFELLHVQIGQGVPELEAFKADHPHISGPKPSCQY